MILRMREIIQGTYIEAKCMIQDVPIEMTTFQLGMRFESSSQFTTAVKNYAVWNGFQH